MWLICRRHDRAIDDLTQCIALDPNNAKAYINRGYVRALNQEFEQAVADYTRAIELQFFWWTTTPIG